MPAIITNKFRTSITQNNLWKSFTETASNTTIGIGDLNLLTQEVIVEQITRFR